MRETPVDTDAAARWLLIERLFDEAVELPRGERTDWLERMCPDSSTRGEVEAMLLAHDRQDGILEVPIADIAGRVAADAGDPESIGAYRILRTLGQGGMGTVYLAVRDDGQFSNRVALKVLKEGVHFEELERRFRTERQILATLQTDCISRILDGGVTEDGRPYFAMEYVEGRPINEYCAQVRASIDQRVLLLSRVADAVQIAHAGLVVHRDLKPSNILVTEEGTVKLLDFGVAKMIAGDETGQDTSLTQTGARWMTPEYAAPEQILAARITTATDIYQLGVVAYELLSGQKPFSGDGQSTFSLQKSICEADALKPSDAAAKTRPTDSLLPAERSRALRGDLDAIILKAIRKEPSERYASAEAFADDLRRYIGSRPVRART
ncbi:MAG: serine/threonine protein kinase, partial [Rhodothermia bacterium]|nr:serine/threonine protein kinase [Rhodothermia bacterium]